MWKTFTELYGGLCNFGFIRVVFAISGSIYYSLNGARCALISPLALEEVVSEAGR